MAKYKTFIITVVTSALFYGQMGFFSSIKKPLAEEFSFTQSYLGLLEGIFQLGNVIGNLCLLLLPFERVKRNFWLLVCLKYVFTLLLIMGKIMGPERSIYFGVLLFILGMSNAPVIIPAILMARYFDSKSESFWVNLWFGITGLGDAFSIFLGKEIMNTLGINWSVYIIIISSLLLLSSLIFYTQIQEGHPMHFTFQERKQKAKNILSSGKAVFIATGFSLAQSFYYNIIMWYPYFYALISQAKYGASITITFSICFLIGTFIFEIVVQKSPKIGDYLAIIFVVGIATIQGICMNTEKSSDAEMLPYYFVLAAGTGFFLGGPESRLAIGETNQIAEELETEFYFILVIENLLRCCFSFVFLFLIGYCLEKDKNSFFIILLVHSLLFLGNEIFRKAYFGCEHKQRSEENIMQLEGEMVEV